MNDDSILGGVLNQLGQTAKKTIQQAVNLPEEKAPENKPQQQHWQSDEERVKFLKDLYGSSEKNSESQAKPQQPAPQPEKKLTEFEEQIKDKSPQEQKKLSELRNQLHKENYYDPTFNPVKKQEERASEKVENEKKQEMQDLQKKEESKPPPLAAQRAAQRVENLPGSG